MRVDYQAKHWLNAINVINAQIDVGTATDTGGWKLGGGSVVIDELFDVAPIFCADCVFRPWFVMHVVSFLVVQTS